jgi:hypothetical protein
VQGLTFPRRRLLTFAAGISLAPLTGCGDTSRVGPSPTLPTSAAVSPDVALVDEVLRDERQLLALVDRTVRAHPSTVNRLRVPRAVVAAHVRWLDSIRPTGRRATQSPVEVVVPRRGRLAIGVVADACRQAAASRRQQCVRARSGALAQRLASMSAAHGVLVVELTGR